MKKYKLPKTKNYKRGKETVVFALNGMPKAGVPEIKVRFNRSKKDFLGKVTQSKDAADFLRKVYTRGTLELQEQFIVLFLNRSNQIIGYYKHTTGTTVATMADIKIILATAMRSLSSALIIAHNHPSGNKNPSEPDIALTRRVKEVAALHEITLLDHIIVTKTDYYSFADNSKL